MLVDTEICKSKILFGAVFSSLIKSVIADDKFWLISKFRKEIVNE